MLITATARRLANSLVAPPSFKFPSSPSSFLVYFPVSYFPCCHVDSRTWNFEERLSSSARNLLTSLVTRRDFLPNWTRVGEMIITRRRRLSALQVYIAFDFLKFPFILYTRAWCISTCYDVMYYAVFYISKTPLSHTTNIHYSSVRLYRPDISYCSRSKYIHSTEMLRVWNAARL